MSQALASHFAHDSLLPRAPGGMAAGAVLALLAHAVLLLALTSTVQWRTSPPEVFNAELWAAVPRAVAPLPAAPPPVPPPVPTPAPPPAAPPPEPRPDAAARPTPPPPAPAARDADIATEQARKLEAQRKLQKAETELAKATAKADAERKVQEAERAKAKTKADADAEARLKKVAEAARKRETETARAAADKLKREEERNDAAQAKAEDERLAKQRAENLRRMMGQATGAGSAGNAVQSGAPSASYVGRLIALIKPNIVFTGQVEGNPSAEVEVRAAADGSIESKRLAKSSGNKEWDEAVLRAIDRTAALPRDNDGSVPRALTLVFRPGG